MKNSFSGICGIVLVLSCMICTSVDANEPNPNEERRLGSSPVTSTVPAHHEVLAPTSTYKITPLQKATPESSILQVTNPSCRKLLVKVTAYTSYACPYYCITFTGTKARWGTIAVDPNIIRFRSTIFVPGYGIGIAEDTGSAIKGNHIDIWFPSEKEAIDWGVKTMEIVFCGP